VDQLPDGVLDLNIYKGEFAARLPNIFASILLVAVVMRLVDKLVHSRAVHEPLLQAILGGLLIGCSPFLIAFGATAFTDVYMVLFAMLSLWMMLAGRGRWSGFWWVLSFASKPQALFFLPLILLVNGRAVARPYKLLLNSFFLNAIVGIGVLFLWDVLRPGESVFLLGTVNNTPGNFFAPLTEIPQRITIWWEYTGWLFGTIWIFVVLIMLALFGWWRKRQQINHRLNAILLLWIIGYVAFHIVSGVNTYDRYWLPLLPVVVIAMARYSGIFWGGSRTASTGVGLSNQRWARYIAPLHIAKLLSIFIITLLIGWQASHINLPFGGDAGHHQGIDEVAIFLNEKPVATVIYDHWLGWHLGYYLGQWTDKRVAYYPTPEALIMDALSLDEQGIRYLPVPYYANPTDWLAALQEANFEVFIALETDRITLYGLIPPSVGADA